MKPAGKTIVLAIAMMIAETEPLQAQFDSPQTRLRPLGAPSAVDQFSRVHRAASPQRAARPAGDRPVAISDASVRQTAWMQSSDPPAFGGAPGMALPPDSGASPPTTNTPPTAMPPATPPGGRSLPSQSSGRSLPSGSASPPPTSALPYSPSDLTPIPTPELSTQSFARVDNCRLVTAPSSYSAASPCGYPPVVPITYSTPITTTTTPVTLPAEIPSAATVPPVTVLPPTSTSPMTVPTVPPSSAPHRAVISLGQERNAVQVGQGLWGQPKAYVPGQWLRNWLRYLTI